MMELENQLIAVEGTIGTNKSQVIYELSKRLSNTNFYTSPDQYQQFSNYKNKCNPLALMYSLPFEYCGFAQVHINRILRNHFNRIKYDHLVFGVNVLTKRSIYSSFIFNETNFQMGFYNEFVYDSISDQINAILYDLNFNETAPQHKIIFTDCALETSVQRILFRSRPEEIQLRHMTAYLQELKEQYNNFLSSIEKRGCKVFYLKTDTSPTISTYEKLIEFIKSS